MEQAEHAANENKQAIPINGSVYQLAQTKCIVFEDASLLAANGTIRKECIPLLTHLAGGKVAVVNNESNVNLDILEKNLMEYGVQLTSHQDINISAREEVLVVIKDQATEKNKVISFYPYCTIEQLTSIAKTMENSKDLRKIIKRNMLITRIWNLAGSIIAIPMVISAPLINLIGDALSLTFMSTAKNWTERRFAPSRPKQESSIEGVSKIPWHTKSSEEILKFYKIDMHNGLTTEQVNQAVPLYGKNQLGFKSTFSLDKNLFRPV